MKLKGSSLPLFCVALRPTRIVYFSTLKCHLYSEPTSVTSLPKGQIKQHVTKQKTQFREENKREEGNMLPEKSTTQESRCLNCKYV